ncbi:Bug family tripartite tricarboxylate transporter substrate binding protein [Ottowia thiooxydans]|uniref:Tripartite-type tricarboxylate transporter receptor subunit TctC n=1 Tax=Ottowia thiooxydans TaxID=219182 RepID=A0ABV2Q978_9BURK
MKKSLNHSPGLCRMLRSALTGLLLGSSVLASISAAAQQAWPTKPVRVILPFGPGSATDIVARAVAEEFRAELGQPFVVDNRAGANGFIAAEAVARAPADGYTLFITSNTTQTNNQFLFKKLPYDPVKDFVPIGPINEQYYVLAVPQSLPVNNVAEFVAWLKANPDKASYGWGAAVAQIAGATFLKEVGATATGVPYKSSPQVTTDLIGGQLSFTVQGVTSGLQVLKSGRLKALMVSSPERVPQLPDVPTGAEAGVPGFRASAFIGVFAPAGTPDHIVKLLNTTLIKALRKPEMIARIDACCAGRFIHSTPAEFAEYLRKDRERWATSINAAGIKPE